MEIKIQHQPMGPYQTNCYIVTVNGKDLIIDPGVDASSWVIKNTTNPIAILNTHGHFDHVWSNKEIKDKFNIPIYCPIDDCFMLEDDPFSQGTPASKADIEVLGDKSFEIDGIKFSFFHFPGHTPGCSAISIENHLFTGDFIFANSIGRVDFPYSNPEDMIKSINKVLVWEDDFIIYPGHGDRTTLRDENGSLRNWLNYL